LKLVIGISGASGVIYGKRLLEILYDINHIETYLVISKSAQKIIKMELDIDINRLFDLANYCYDSNDISAPISSGSFKTDGMIISPCSMKTLAGIAQGYSSNLLLRAADVTLKERRPLILVPRESPLSAIHLENMLKLARLGVFILPPVPAFYNKPERIEEIVNYTVGKILDIFKINHNLFKRWGN